MFASKKYFSALFSSVFLLATVLPVAAQSIAPVNVLHAFTSGATGDGSSPQTLVQATDGNFYGTTSGGGTNGYGTFFQLTPGGVLTTLATAASANAFPTQLVAGTDGNLYGIMSGGGTNGSGDLVRLTTAGTLTDVCDFDPRYSGAVYSPSSHLIVGSDNNFYGTSNTSTVVYQITSTGTLTSIANIGSLSNDTDSVITAFFQGNDGNIYGAFSSGYGTTEPGSIFEVTPTGTLTVLHTFSTVNGYNANADGQDPRALVQGKDGNFYGVTNQGGANGKGTFFSLTPAGVLTDLHDFNGEEIPFLLVASTDGNIYGTGLNTITEFTTAGVVTVLHSFGSNYSVDGDDPRAFFQSGDGLFYGTLASGGPSNAGTIFEFDPTVRSSILQFSASSYQTTENAGSVALTVQRTGSTTGAVSVTCATDDADFNGMGYTPTSATLTWADGDATDKTFTVPIVDEHVTSGTTYFNVILSAPTGGAVLGAQSAVSVNITDNDTLTPPTINITSPPDGTQVSTGQTVPFAASILDPNGLFEQVQFFINDSSVYVSTGSGPYIYNATVPPIAGTYVVKAVVTDINGGQNISTITVKAVAPTTGTTPPTVAVLSPFLDANGLPRNLLAGSTLTVSFTAASADGTELEKVSLYADGVLVATFDGSGNLLPMGAGNRPVHRDAAKGLGTVFQTPYTLPGSDKIINMIAVALDKLGHSTVSNVASIHSTVTSNKAPRVTLGGLTNGTHVKVGAKTKVSVSASDPDAVSGAVAGSRAGRQDALGNAVLARLEYYINGLLDHTTTAAPFDFDFSPPSSGKFVLNVVATDGAGLATISDPITVDADGDTPTVNVTASAPVAMEGGDKGVVVVTRTGDTSAALTVNYKVKGSAQAGVDYKGLPNMVTIPVGAAKAKIKVKAIDSPNTGVLKVKIVVATPTDGSYVVGTGTAKVKIVGR